MRAAYYEAFGGPENLQIGELSDPLPGAGQMLVRTQAAGVGIWDVGMMRSGHGPVAQVAPPHIPGSEIAGTVAVAAGPFTAGERVFGTLFWAGGGGFAELAAARVDGFMAMPDHLEFSEAAGLVIPAGTAYEGLVDRAKLQDSEAVLITAASGGVGTAAVQIAKSLGAHVVAVASARHHDYVRDLGAELAVDYHDPDFVEQLRSAVPSGFDVLFDGTGNDVRDQVVGLVRNGGRGIFIAGAPPAREGVEFQAFAATVNPTRLEAVARLVSEGKLRMPIEAEFPLERAREAMEQVGARHTVGRVVLRISL